MRGATLLLLAGVLLAGTPALAEPQQAAGSTTPFVFTGLEQKAEEAPSFARQSLAPQQVAQCCKICRKGKACGNSCISKSYTCRKPPGCACDAN